MCIVDFTKHICLIRTQTQQFSFLSQFVLFMHTLSPFSENRNISNLAPSRCSFSPLLRGFCAFSSSPEMILVARIIHSHVFANLMYFKQGHQEYFLLNLRFFYCRHLTYRLHRKTRWYNVTSTVSEAWLHNYRHVTPSFQRLDSGVREREREREREDSSLR